MKRRTKEQKIKAKVRKTESWSTGERENRKTGMSVVNTFDYSKILGYDISLIYQDLFKTIGIAVILIAGLIILTIYLR